MGPDNTKKETEPTNDNGGQHKDAAQAGAKGAAKAHVPQFADLKEVEMQSGEQKKIDFLYDIKLDVNIELGRAELKVKDILSLQPGSIVELNRLAGDPVEIVVNNKTIARGEVIVIDDNFAVRVTDVLDPSEIAQKLHKGKN
jgi:flagellar motor switch protein FliN/FliY